MVKLSEIIRKPSEKKFEDEPESLSKAIRAKENQENLIKVKNAYENVIFFTKGIINNLREGRTVEGKDVVRIAETILDRLHVSNEILLSLINIFVFYGEREDYFYSHSVNVAILASNLGLSLGYNEPKLIDLCASCLLHDIGLLKIPREITAKLSKLSPEEYNLIKKHPLYGLEILKYVKDPPKSAPQVIYQHHERVDGKGYPEGRIGDEISEFAKIASIAEVYESITHPRPYREHKIIPYDAVKMIVQEVKSSFEPKYVRVFLNFVTPYPLGTFVLLSSREIGKVIGINDNIPLRPIVEVYFDSDGKPPENPRIIDLAKCHLITIKKALDEDNL